MLIFSELYRLFHGDSYCIIPLLYIIKYYFALLFYCIVKFTYKKNTFFNQESEMVMTFHLVQTHK